MAEDKYETGKAGNAFIDLSKGARKDFGKDKLHELMEKVRKETKKLELGDILKFSRDETDIFIAEINCLSKGKRQKLIDVAIECCYDEKWCDKKKINYFNLSDKEYNAVLVYNYLKLKGKK